MDVRMFIGACLLLATVAYVSGANDGPIGLNFCKKTVKTFSKDWKNGHGRNELVKKITKEHKDVVNWRGISNEKWTEYGKLKTQKNLQMCIDFRYVYQTLEQCIGSLAASGWKPLTYVNDSVLKSWEICARMFQTEVEQASSKKGLEGGKVILESCSKTVHSFRQEWGNSFKENRLVEIIGKERPTYRDWEKISGEEWTAYREIFLKDPLNERMCQDFLLMRSAAAKCKYLLYINNVDQSPLLGNEPYLDGKIQLACMNIYPGLAKPFPKPQ